MMDEQGDQSPIFHRVLQGNERVARIRGGLLVGAAHGAAVRHRIDSGRNGFPNPNAVRVAAERKRSNSLRHEQRRAFAMLAQDLVGARP